jgi:two-component system, OmpR family, KDP operon response regulator KdpE
MTVEFSNGAAMSPWGTSAAPRPFAASAGQVIVAGSSTEKRLEVRTALESKGYGITEATAPQNAIRRSCSGEFDLLILDSVIDGIGPYEMCQTIRSKSNIGIIVLRREECDPAGSDLLNAGADDFLSAVLLTDELVARVRAVLRRVPRPASEEQVIILADRMIDLRSRKVTSPGGRVEHLTPKEFLVLTYLLAHAGQPRTHQNLAQTVWNRNAEGEIEYVRIVIRQLRRKLEPDPEHPRYILTERAIGYRLRLSNFVQTPSLPARRIDTRAMALSV